MYIYIYIVYIVLMYEPMVTIEASFSNESKGSDPGSSLWHIGMGQHHSKAL